VRCLQRQATIARQKDSHTINAAGESRGHHADSENVISRRGCQAKTHIFRADGQDHLLFYFYKSRKRYTASYWQQQIHVTLSRLRDPNASDALIRVITPVVGGRWEEARSRLTGFLGDIIPHVDEALP